MAKTYRDVAIERMIATVEEANPVKRALDTQAPETDRGRLETHGDRSK